MILVVKNIVILSPAYNASVTQRIEKATIEIFSMTLPEESQPLSSATSLRFVGQFFKRNRSFVSGFEGRAQDDPEYIESATN